MAGIKHVRTERHGGGRAEGFTVEATVWAQFPGGERLELRFDPTPFLGVASETELEALASASWSGQVVLMAVQCLAHFGDRCIREWFRQLDRQLMLEDDFELSGRIDAGQAVRWIVDYRPQVIYRVLPSYAPTHMLD